VSNGGTLSCRTVGEVPEGGGVGARTGAGRMDGEGRAPACVQPDTCQRMLRSVWPERSGTACSPALVSACRGLCGLSGQALRAARHLSARAEVYVA